MKNEAYQSISIRSQMRGRDVIINRQNVAIEDPRLDRHKCCSFMHTSLDGIEHAAEGCLIISWADGNCYLKVATQAINGTLEDTFGMDRAAYCVDAQL